MASPEGGGGYRYEASIASWTTGHSQGEDNVVYYVLELKLYAPAQGDSGGNGSDVGVVRSVQRRFSDFRRLYDMLCMLYGNEKMADKQIPDLQNGAGAGGFAQGNSSQSDLIGARREALDLWVSMLAGDGQLSWCPPVTAFLQVDQAVKEHRSAGSTGIGGFFARRRRRSRSGSVNSTSSASEVSDAPTHPPAPSPNGGPQPSPSSLANELKGLKAFLASETATKEFLAKRVSELEAELRDAVAERDELRAESAQSASAEKMNDLQFELQEALGRAETLEREREGEAAARRDLEGRVEAARSEVREREGDLERSRARAEASEAEKEAIAKNAAEDVRTMAREVKRLQKAAMADRARAKKREGEAERMRESLGGLRALDDEDASSVMKVLREAEVLHSRVRECAFGKLMADEGGAGDGTEGSDRAEDVFQLSDNRISCLLAEVQFLTECDKELESKLQRGRQESNERLRQTLANILIEHAHLQRACNRMSRDAIVGGAEDNNPANSSTNYQPPTEDMVSLI